MPKVERDLLFQQVANSLKVLSKRSEFLILSKFGRKLKPSNWLLLNYKKNKLNQFRCGWTVPRYVGNAVLRNKLKRWSRELFRETIKNEIAMDVNLVFLKQDKDFYRELTYDNFKETFKKGIETAQQRL